MIQIAKYKFVFLKHGCLVAVVTLCLSAVSGCSDGGDKQPLVTGTVSYQGVLLDHGSLRFFGENGRPTGSVIQKDGSYEIELSPGDYQVSVSLPPKSSGNAEDVDSRPLSDANALPSKFSQPTTSRLSVQVPLEGTAVEYNIDMK